MLDSRSRTTTRDEGTSPMRLVTCTVVTAVENHHVVGQTTNIDVATLDATMGFTVLHDSKKKISKN